MANIKLLLIDDEVKFATTLCQRLQLRDFDATCVHTGGEGLAVLSDIKPEIVILDLKMPDMDGLEVLEKIKEYNKSIEVILLTGHGFARSGVEAMEKGAFDYLMKPVYLNELLDKINSAAEKSSKA